MEATRAAEIRQGIRIEIVSILWMVIEMAVSIGAGIAAGSILLTAFGIDSLIELISGGILLWRLRVESLSGNVEQVEQTEHRAEWIVAITLALLCVYVAISAVYGLIAHSKPEITILGIGISRGSRVYHALSCDHQAPHFGSYSQRSPGRRRRRIDHLRIYGRDSFSWAGAQRAVRMVVGRIYRRSIPTLAGAGNMGSIRRRTLRITENIASRRVL